MDEVTQYLGAKLDSTVLIGPDLLDLITSGMYADPLILYREYIQNAADAIELLPNPQDGRIEVEINASRKSIVIRDNGPGLTFQQAVEALIPIAKSSKNRERNRGFRGIGRICGLAFANSIAFRTRTTTESAVSLVVWDGESLRRCISQNLSIADTVSRCVEVKQLESLDAPANYFEVEIRGVSRQAAIALNCVTVSDYVSEIGPVPFPEDFPYQIEVKKFVGEHSKLYEVPVKLFSRIGESIANDVSIVRPHSNVTISQYGKGTNFVEIEKFLVPKQSGEGLAAIGWIAHTHYEGALPKSLGVRCLRARVGNMQIGRESAFDHLFSESRFNRWCIGEVHILDAEILPNGNRDYFELNVHLRNFENHLRHVCRNIERRCRTASRYRSQQRKIQSVVEDAEAVLYLSSSGLLPDLATARLILQQRDTIATLSQKDLIGNSITHQDQLDSLVKKLDSIQEGSDNKLATMLEEDQRIYKNIFLAITETSSSLSKARETIISIMEFRENHKDMAS